MTTPKKKAAGLSALKNVKASEEEEVTPQAQPRKKRTPAAKKATSTTQPSTKAPSPASAPLEKVSFSLNMPEEAYTKLREMGFHERATMTKLILEGIDLLFENRGMPPVSKK